MKKQRKHYTPEEKVAILLEGYRRLRTFMMLDADIVAVSPAGVWRVEYGVSRQRSGLSSGGGACGMIIPFAKLVAEPRFKG